MTAPIGGATRRHGHVLAFDCGTTSLKAAVIGPDGAISAEAAAGYALHHAEGGHVEQDAEEIWTAVVDAGRAAVAASGVDPDQITAVVFAATWKALLPLDTHGNPIGKAAIWIDSRGREQARRLNEKLGRFVGTGQEYWPRAMWFKEQRPDIWNRARYFVGLNTYFKLRATGVLANEPSDDFIYGVDEHARAEFDEVLASADLLGDRDKFVLPKPAEAFVGHLTDEAAARFGISAGTDVYNGFGDLPAIMIGTGTGDPGRAHIYLGSSSWFVHATSTPPQHAPLSFTVSRTLYGAAYVVQSACLAYDWAVAQLYRAEKLQLGKGINELVNREVAEVEPGSDNLLATHWINGELPPLSKNSKGLFLNLTAMHDRRHMVRAIMESICYAHRASYETYLADGGTALVSIRVVGGGALSDVWMQMLTDVLGVPVEVPSNPQSTGTLGAYFSAQVGMQLIESYADIDDVITIERRFTPVPANVDVYNRLYPIYAQLHSSLRDIFVALNGDY